MPRPLVPVLLLLVVVGLVACRRGPAPDAGSVSAAPAQVDLRVRGRPQARSLSCESRSACDLLGYLGVPCTESGFLAGLPRSDNPHEGFVGDVDGPGEQLPPSGYGVYAEPIAARMRALGVDARVHRGRDLEWLRAQLAARRPVIVWAPATLQALRPVRMTDQRGRDFDVVRGEHTFLAVGYGRGEILLLDPANGRTRRVFQRRFDRAWAVLGRMAVVVEPTSE